MSALCKDQFDKTSKSFVLFRTFPLILKIKDPGPKLCPTVAQRLGHGFLPQRSFSEMDDLNIKTTTKSCKLEPKMLRLSWQPLAHNVLCQCHWAAHTPSDSKAIQKNIITISTMIVLLETFVALVTKILFSWKEVYVHIWQANNWRQVLF